MPKLSGNILNFILFLLVALGAIGAWRVDVEENALDLLPGEALRGDLELLQELGVLNQIFISLETPTAGDGGAARPELLAGAGNVGKALAASPHFRGVFYRLPEGYQFGLAADLGHFLPVLAGPDDLDEIEHRLTPELLTERLRQDFLDLNSPAGMLMARQVRNDPLGFLELVLGKISTLRGRMRVTVQDGYFVSEDGRHCLLWAESVDSLTASESALRVRNELDRILSAGLDDGVSARIIGPLPHTLANASTIKKDLARLLPAALFALVMVLLLFLRDWRALVVVGMPFLAAPAAVSFLDLLYPQPSAMALGFGIVLLGIGVDFAVHLYLGSRNESGRVPVPPLLRRALLLAALTTISVFVVLLFSQVPAHRQMAVLAISGLILALFLSWRLVPLLPGRIPAVSPGATHFRTIFSGKRSLPVLAIWVLLLLGGIMGWSRLHYNGNLKSLDVPDLQVQEDEKVFLATWGREGEQAFVVSAAESAGAALNMNDRVYALLSKGGDRLNGTQSLSPLLPGPELQDRNLEGWHVFWSTRLPLLRMELPRIAVEQGFAANAFQSFLDGVDQDPEALTPEVLTDGPLRPLLSGLFRHAPEETGDGKYLVTTLVPDNPETADVLAALPEKIPGVTVLSNSRWRQEMDVLLKSDILRLTSAAALLVLLICLVIFRSFRSILAVLAPVLSAQAAMALFAGMTSEELNLMHLLMGIMVIGLSVDYGIFVVTACREGLSGRTFLAVTICALSTLSGFGVLALAAHPALHALGVTVLVGIGAAWPTALLVSPVLAGTGEG